MNASAPDRCLSFPMRHRAATFGCLLREASALRFRLLGPLGRVVRRAPHRAQKRAHDVRYSRHVNPAGAQDGCGLFEKCDDDPRARSTDPIASKSADRASARSPRRRACTAWATSGSMTTARATRRACAGAAARSRRKMVTAVAMRVSESPTARRAGSRRSLNSAISASPSSASSVARSGKCR